MSEFIAFTLGGIFGVVLMCCLQINRLSARKEWDAYTGQRGKAGSG